MPYAAPDAAQARSEPSARAGAAPLGLRFDAGRRVLRITPVPPEAEAAAASPSSPSPAVQLCAVGTEAGERIVLAEAQRADGWTSGSSSRGRPGCLLHPGTPVRALEVPVGADRVAVLFERAVDGGAAVVEFAGQTRLVALEGDGPIEVQLGRGIPHHAWREPRMAPYERSLAHDAGFAGSDRSSFAQRVAFDRQHALDPHPVLPAASSSLPLALTYPELFLPAGAEVALGIVRAKGENSLHLRIDARFDALLAGPAAVASSTFVLDDDRLHRVDLPLSTSHEGTGRLTLRIEATGPSATEGATVELVDPVVRGLATANPERPNVIVITLDTVRADHLSAYGYGRATTPFLESIAGRSRVFDSAYAQVTNTRPSHFSMFTGRYCSDLGIWNNDGPPLPQRELALAEVLQSAGWSTGAVVSVGFLGPGSGLEQGFDEVHVPPRGSGHAQLGAETTRTALGFLRRHAGKPFHLWVHYFDAHLPYQPVPELRSLFWKGPPPSEENVDRSLILPEFFDGLFVLPHVAYMTAMYDASLRYLDDQLRVLFDYLRAADLLEETIVVIAADHGESLGEHGIYFVHAGLHETTVHVPLLIHGPQARVRPGRVPDVVENLSVPATVVSLVGLHQPESFRGESLLRDPPGDGAAFFEHYGGFSTGMRRGALKLIDSRALGQHRERLGPSLRLWYEAPPLRLYDLASDPSESDDLAERRPELLRENLAVLDQWRADHATRRPIAAPRDPKLGESLRALGYVE